MNDFSNFEKILVRELSCRLCLCTDVVKLKPLSAELKRKIKRLFDIVVRADDALPKAICHDCLQHVSALHLYSVKVDKTQKFLEYHKAKVNEKRDTGHENDKIHPLLQTLSAQNVTDATKKSSIKPKTPPTEQQQGDSKKSKKKSPADMKFLEAMPLDEFVTSENIDKSLLDTTITTKPESRIAESRITESRIGKNDIAKKVTNKQLEVDYSNDVLDPIVIIDGRPAKAGVALDRQITLFYKMECCICHENGFHFRSLMKHYKERHGVPGYVTCCEKKFHYFYPKKIIEHMAYHLQTNIFMCHSCHRNFLTSQELIDHQSNGGRSEGKIICPKCQERYPTYHELGLHIISHRVIDKLQCDYCGKPLKHHHRKKTVNHMEDVILCSQCIRLLRNIEKQEKEIKEKVKAKCNDNASSLKHQKFRQAMGLSEEDASTE